MSWRNTFHLGLLVAVMAACGGTVSTRDPYGQGGSANTGASSNQGGASANGGTPSGCEAVVCDQAPDCPAGYVLAHPVGACCQGCVPQPSLTCPKVACPHSTCPLGYVRGDLVGGCCTECVPDVLFCNETSDCLVADKPRTCCGCPEIISRRVYDVDACWSDVAAPRNIPPSCYPDVTCDAVCGPCASSPSVSCENHRCWDVGLK